jgi:hypothetical protein
MSSSGMRRRVDLVRTDVPEEYIASIITVLQLLVTANVVPSSLILFTLMMETIRSSETSVCLCVCVCVRARAHTHTHTRNLNI